MTTPGPAELWAGKATTPLRWRELEVAAFRGHGDVLDQLDPQRRYGHTGPRGRLHRQAVLLAPVALLVLVAVVAPIGGFAFLQGDRWGLADVDMSVALPRAAVAYGTGLLALLAGLAAWVWQGRPPSRGRSLQAGTAVAMSVLGLVSGLTGGAAEASGAPALLGVVAACGVVGVVAAVVLRVAARPEAAAPGEPLARVRREVAKVPDDVLSAVRADQDAALAELERRGLATSKDVAWARQADLGMLAHHMSQKRRTTS